VYRQVEDCCQARKVNELMRRTDNVLTHICWQPPCGYFVKLNIGARKDHDIARCGSIFRGSQRE
jgi:hypothetical protein